MQIPVDVQFRGMEPSLLLDAVARAQLRELGSMAPEIKVCRVRFDTFPQHRRQGQPVGVRIDLTCCGHELVVPRVQSDDAYRALDQAFDLLKRQLV